MISIFVVNINGKPVVPDFVITSSGNLNFENIKLAFNEFKTKTKIK